MTVRDAIYKTRGKFFTVHFIKRTTGTLRIMTARTGVVPKKRKGTLAYRPVDHGLVLVYDVHKRGYRMVPEDGVKYMCFNGRTRRFRNGVCVKIWKNTVKTKG